MTSEQMTIFPFTASYILSEYRFKDKSAVRQSPSGKASRQAEMHSGRSKPME